mgnify:CR=1 FL=1
MDVLLPMHHALLSTWDHILEQQMRVARSHAYDCVCVDDGDIRPRHIEVQGIQPPGMDAEVALAFILGAIPLRPIPG